ncbi:MAG TPA: hypothetical protein GX742_02105 [Acholeplasmataceae bacterium]|nr:hypothetical protein [Acholeplasmataceae bacterium]
MKKVLKISYLSSAIIYLIGVNYISYTLEPYSLKEPLIFKILLSLLSVLIMTFVYILLIKPDLIIKKQLNQETIVMLYLSIIVIPLISLYA